ncbi:hypothetical protein JW921_05675 [Candidatus Fermentibacterales bacterium]|nr:hypothetical protein [Candidatus Fermentibacterales bacterium]
MRTCSIVLPMVLLSLLPLGPAQAPAQSEPEAPGPDRGSPEAALPTDSSRARSYEPIPERSPTGALLRSAVLPGWGQIYNDRPVKGLLMGAAEIGLAVWLVLEHLEAEEARDEYASSGDPADLARYESHKQRRLDLIWYTSGAWLIGMLDAYVDAHLYAFEEENREFERKVGIGVALTLRL